MPITTTAAPSAPEPRPTTKPASPSTPLLDRLAATRAQRAAWRQLTTAQRAAARQRSDLTTSRNRTN